MELNLTNLVPDQIVKALCNTLIHSLWQGLILAIITGLTIVLTKKSSAALRYNLMLSFLLLFAAATVSTFLIELRPAASNITARSALNKPVQQLQMINNQGVYTEKPGNVIATGISYFTSHADAIVLIWFLIICARCVQFAAGLQHIYYLRRNKTIAAGPYWERKINALAYSMGITTTVSIMQSGIAKIPMVLGHFKPVILIPIGLLTALSAEEVESILIHELAHIRRKDFMINLLQNLMEIIFFFNPAVLWVSALIKSERENCCDDIVVAQTSSKVSYIKALVSCEEYHSAMPAYAMGLGGKNGHFLNRVKRMLSNNNQSLNRMEKAVLTICLVSAVIITAAFSKPKNEKPVSKPKNIRSAAGIILKKADSLNRTPLGTNDTITTAVLKIYKTDDVSDGTIVRFDKSVNHRKYFIYLAKKDGVLYQVNSTYDGKLDKYYINSKLVTADKLPQYQSQFDEIFNQDVPKPARPATPGETLQLNGGKGEIVDDADNKVVPAQADNTNPALDSIKRAYWNQNLGPLSPMKSRLSTAAKLDSVRADMKARIIAMTDSTRRHYIKSPNPPAGPGSPPTPPVGAAYKPYAPYKSVYKPYAPQKPMPPVAPLPNMGDEIAEELLNSDLIKDKDNYTFRITNDGLYVDGVKQSDEVYKKIVGKYVKPGDKINYTRTSTTKN